jgi:hypothetical protein
VERSLAMYIGMQVESRGRLHITRARQLGYAECNIEFQLFLMYKMKVQSVCEGKPSSG